MHAGRGPGERGDVALELSRSPGARVRRRWRAGWAAALALAGALAGCVPDRLGVPADALRRQVLPPPGVGLGEPAAPPGPGPSAAVTELLPAPRSDDAPPPQREKGAAPEPAAEDRPAPQAPPGPAGPAMTLPQALQMTERANPHLRVLRARVERAESGEDVAFADFLPS